MWPLKSHHEKQAPHLVAILSSRSDCEVLTELAQSQGWRLLVARGIEEGRAAVNSGKGAAVLLIDRDLVPEDWRSVVEEFVQARSSPSLILASRMTDRFLFEEVVKHGGFDVVGKPLNREELRRMILSGMQFRERRWRDHASG